MGTERPVTLREHFAAANARIAELEAAADEDSAIINAFNAREIAAKARIAGLEKNLKACQDTAADTWGVLVREANARADAAEREQTRNGNTAHRLLTERDAERAETARLRALVTMASDSASTLAGDCTMLRDECNVMADAKEALEETVTAERVETARLRLLLANADDQETETGDWNTELQYRLAAATELLIQAADGHAENPQWVRDFEAFLSAQPAPAKEEP